MNRSNFLPRAAALLLTLVLVALLPFMGGAVFFISRRGTPLYQNVQRAADQLVRVVR